MMEFFQKLGFWGRSIALIALAMISGLVFIIIGDISAVLIFGQDAMVHSDVPVLQFLQSVISVGLFLVPGVALCVLCRQGSVMRRVFLSPAPRPVSLLLCLAIMLVSVPFVGWLEEVNLSMTLPESMSGIENWMRSMEDEALRITKKLTDSPDVSCLVANVFALALFPALCEEMLFRAGLQQAVIIDTTRINKYAAALIAAFIFSAIHFQFFGFLPRFVLGTFLGLMLVITGNIWASVISHFANNAMAVVCGFMEARGMEDSISQFTEKPIVIVLSALLSLVFFVLLYRYEKKVLK